MKNLFDILVSLFLICLSLGQVDPTAEAKVDQYTIAVWLFEEGSGDWIKDASGNGHRGKLSDKPKRIKTKFGHGLKLPGDASGYVVVESSKKPKLKELTIEAFIQSTKPAGKWQGIICQRKAGCCNKNYSIWVHATNNKLHAQTGSGGACDFSID